MRHWLCLAGLVLLALPVRLFAQTPIPIPGTRPEAVSTGLGGAVAASGAYLAATDFRDNAVYVFRTAGGAWTLDARLEMAPGVLVGTRAGGIAFSGTRLVVGAPGADEGRGAAFVFERGPAEWTQMARLEPTERTQYAQFGVSVAVAGDRIVVGQTGLFLNRGEYDAAVVFAREASGAWRQEAHLVSGIPPNANDSQIDAICFGWSIAAHDDQIAVGAPCTTSPLSPRGRVYVFRRDASGWVPGAPIETPTGGPVLGGVAFAGPDLIVSSSRGWHVYRDGVLATVLADTLASEGIPYSRALSGSDSLIVALGRNSRGMHLVRFERAGGGWSLRREGTFMPRPFASASSHVSGTPSHSVFGNWIEGHVLARAADGSRTDTLRAPGLARAFWRGTQAGAALDLHAGRLIVGLPGADAAAPAPYEDRRGGAVVVSPPSGARLIAGPAARRLTGQYVGVGDGLFALGSSQHYEVYGDVSPSPLFSTTVASARSVASLDAGGGTVAAGVITTSTQVGEVHVVTCSPGGPCGPTTTLTHVPTPNVRGERFGQSVAVDASGTGLAVGAPVFNGGSTGQVTTKVSLYTRDPSGAWQLERQLDLPDGSSLNALAFGRGVARSRDTVAVEGFDHLYVFVRHAFGWMAEVPIRIPTVTPSLPRRLALGAGRIAVGAPSPNQTPGRVLVFQPSSTPGTWTLDRTLDGGARGGVSFGTSVAIDGTRLVVGAPGAASGAGEVYEYDLGTGVAAEGEAAASALSMRVPNPVRAGATVRYVLDRPARVRLAVYDVLGRLVATLVDDDRAEGTHEIAFAAGLAPGAYVVRLNAGDRTRTRTVVVLR